MDSDNRLLALTVPGKPLSMGDYRQTLCHWVRWQHQKECFWIIGDLQHRLDDADCDGVAETALERAIELLAAGIDPGAAALVLESRVPELSEISLLLSGVIPANRLEQAARIAGSNASEVLTAGEHCASLLRVAAILGFRVGQVALDTESDKTLELSRQVARRFNYLYGREEGFESNAEAAIKKLGKKTGKLYKELRKSFRSSGDTEALETARALIQEQSSLTLSDQERLLGYLEGSGVAILNEPERMQGWVDAANDRIHADLSSDHPLFLIPMLAAPDRISKRVSKLSTDAGRLDASDPGNPDACEVWRLHQEYTLDEQRIDIEKNCRKGTWGCAECKRNVSSRLSEVFEPMRQKAERYQGDRELLVGVMAGKTEESRDLLRQTLDDMKSSLGLDYR